MSKTKRLLLLLGVMAWGIPAWAEPVEGQLQWLRKVALSTPVSGVVSEVHVQAGDRVGKGDPLLTLEQRGFRAELQRAKANVEKRRQAAEEAARELERAQELYDRTLLSQHDLDVAQIANTAAQAELNEAEAALVKARLDLEYSVVRAPFDGIVLSRPGELGQTVITRLEAVPLVVLADPERMVARVAVGENVLAGLKDGAEVGIRVDGRRYAGRISRLGFEPVDPAVTPPRYAVDAVFEPGRPLRAGQSVTVDLP